MPEAVRASRLTGSGVSFWGLALALHRTPARALPALSQQTSLPRARHIFVLHLLAVTGGGSLPIAAPYCFDQIRASLKRAAERVIQTLFHME